jgi:hypothetical protein
MSDVGGSAGSSGEQGGGQTPGSSQFDMASMAMATKVVLLSGILLLIVSFLPWQKVCAGGGEFLGTTIPRSCASASAWGGSGAIFGLLMGLLLIALLVFEVVRMTNAEITGNLPIEGAKLAAYLGFAVVGLGVIKFIIAITSKLAGFNFDLGGGAGVSNSAGIGAWAGIVLLVALAYGSWLHFKESETA